ncbi:MAG: helix-turn-helix domain-containing protein [Proteobacteria bacterium]|nr:helix-turn-helix domain-containing protein [Pseudomonadota bacterium]
MTVFNRGRAVRDWLLSVDEVSRTLHINDYTTRALVREGFIKPAPRKGFYRLGHVLDGYAEAVRIGRIHAPHARGQNPAYFACPLPMRA